MILSAEEPRITGSSAFFHENFSAAISVADFNNISEVIRFVGN